MTTSYSLAVISDRLQALTRQLDADPNLPGRMLVYDGTRPANGQAPDSASFMLGQLIFPKPSLDSVTGTQLTLRNPATALVQVTGLATWARLVNGAGQHVADMDVGIDGDPLADVVIRKGDGTPAVSTQLYAGGEFSVVLARHVEA